MTRRPTPIPTTHVHTHRHASIKDVPAVEVDAFFQPLPPGLELQLPEGPTGQARL